MLKDTRIIITAGPTVEPIDPVRFLSNNSSGKMGYALAQVATKLGVTVTLVSGPTHLNPPDGITLVQVKTAVHMHDAVMDQIDAHDIFISAAAVADYRPATYQDDKIKKHDDTLTLELIKNPDILLDVSQRTNCPFLVGFAAESNTPLENGRAKLAIKNLDMIAINDISKPGIGFGSNDNALTVLAAQQHADPVVYELAQTDKLHLAEQLLQLMEKHYDASCSN